MLKIGQIINGVYEVEEPIGEGGSGQVFKAWHKNLQKYVVIKRIKDNYVGRINERKETDILKNIKHSNLPQVYDFIQMDTEVYTVMDYIDGNTMMEYIKAGVRFDEPQTIKWLKDLCAALHYLHSQNPPIIHSDIKPSNIMIDAAGNISLIDFNISLNDPDNPMTTGYSKNYAAPEQLSGISSQKIQGVNADARTDIFSLGASFYQLMSRKNALKQIEAGLPLWDDSTPYSRLLTDIIDKALEKNPSKRFQSASDMYKSLDTMKLRDRRYKRLGRVQTVYTLICLIVFAAGVYMTVKGGLLRREEAFGQEYDELIDNAGTMSEDEIIEGAFSLLNNTSYTRILDNNSHEKGTILYLAASSYFEKEDYESAIKLYEEAIETDGSDPDNYRDLAIAYARSGDTDKAQMVLEKAINQGLDDSGLYLVRGEIAGADQKYNDAIDDYLKVLELSGDEDIIARAGILCARAYVQLDDYKNADLILTDVFERVSGKWSVRVMRENAQICLKYLEKNCGEDFTEWISKADECYTYLLDHSQATSSDYINLSYIKNMNGETDKALEIMTLAAELYPEDYRIPMRQAEYCMILQGSLLEDERDYSKVLEYYEKAKNLYDKVKVSGDSDDEMQRLENDIEELYALGWLQ